jgi:hypothetical protein
LRIDLQPGEHPVDERLDGDLKVAPVVEPVVRRAACPDRSTVR